MTPNHTFPFPGVFAVTLMVTDVAGLTDTDTMILTVLAPGGGENMTSSAMLLLAVAVVVLLLVLLFVLSGKVCMSRLEIGTSVKGEIREQGIRIFRPEDREPAPHHATAIPESPPPDPHPPPPQAGGPSPGPEHTLKEGPS